MSLKDNTYQNKKFRENLKKFEEAQSLGKSVYLEPEEITDIAGYYYVLGNVGKAISTIEYAIRMFPGALSPLVYRARIALLAENDPVKADEFAEMISDKSDLDYFFIKAEIMISDSRIDEADTYLKEVYEQLDDTDKADFVIDTAMLYADYEIVDKAQEWLDLSTEYEASDYQELQGRIEMFKGNFDESERIFNRLIDTNPYSALYWNHLASSQFLHNDIQESIKSSEFSLAINPDDDEALLNKANGLFKLGNFIEAEKCYRRFIETCPGDEMGEMYLGITLLNQNKLNEGLVHLLKAEQLSPVGSKNLRDIYIELIYTLSSLHRYDECQKYITLFEQLEETSKDEAYVLRGHVHLLRGDMQEAVKLFQQAIESSHGAPDIFLRIGISVYDCGYFDLSYKMFHTLFSIVDDEWKDGWSYLALCCKELGKNEEYVEAVRRACELNPDEARLVLGDFFPPTLSPEQYVDYILHQK